MLKFEKKSRIIIIYLLLFSLMLFFYDNNPNQPDKLILNDKLESVNSIKFSIKEEWMEKTDIGNDYQGNDIIVDSEGYIYITGRFYNTSQSSYDIIIAKYNRLGSQVWNRKWGGTLDDIGTSLYADSFNNIIIAGRTKSFGNGNYDICLIKYNSSGHLLWNYTWGGMDYDSGQGIVVDNKDNIYIAGYTESIGTFGDVVLLKFNSTGTLNYTRTWGDVDTDAANDIALDSEGNIYLTGYTNIITPEKTDLFLLKFNNSGYLNWSKTWGGQYVDSGESLIIDSSNNIFVASTTRSFSVGGEDIALLKFNHTGGLQWNTTWGGAENDGAFSVALDHHNHIYLTGSTKSYDGLDEDLCLIKFNATGDFQWIKLQKSTTNDEGKGLVVDQAHHNDIYITGRIGTDLCIIKYSQLPDEFSIVSDAMNGIDSDGTFSLSWTISLDAVNYSLYQFDKPVVEYNDSLIEIVRGNTNRTYSFITFDQGEYYFIVYAYNEYGNMSSNCIKVRVIYPPQNFALLENEQLPDTDGKVNLTWTESIGANNYSIYSHHSYIHEIDNNGTLVYEGLTNQSYLIEGLENQDIYYIIISENLGGQAQSNCIKVKVRRAPDGFQISTDANDPDEGTYVIIWTKSNYAANYSVYFSTIFINDLNGDVHILLEGFTPEFDWPTFRFKDTRSTGVYYYKVISFNEYGNYSSECIKITVLVPESSGNSDKKEIEESMEFNFPILTEAGIIFSLIGVLGAMIYVKKHRNNGIKGG